MDRGGRARRSGTGLLRAQRHPLSEKGRNFQNLMHVSFQSGQALTAALAVLSWPIFMLSFRLPSFSDDLDVTSRIDSLRG